MTIPTPNSLWTFAGQTVQVLHVSEPYHKFGRMWPSEVLYIFSGKGRLEPRTRILSLQTFLSLYDREKENHKKPIKKQLQEALASE